MFNMRGEVIGINTAIFSPSGGSVGIGFAIPGRLARGVMESIIEHGRVIRGWAGVEVQNVTSQLAESFGLESRHGVVVAGVMRGGPAAAAGLSPGDVILAINGDRVSNAQDLLHKVTEHPPGETIRMKGLSDGERTEWEVTVRERPAARELLR